MAPGPTMTRGEHFIGKEICSCVLERLLGYGGSSEVFLARSLTSEIQEQFAVKVFQPRSPLDGQMRKSFYERFLQEARAASQLTHNHILSVYAYGEHEGQPYIMMPYMAGGTLSEYVQQHGPLSLQEALHYLEQIADALDYAHANKCIHCDVKPANILLDLDGNAALSDFGIAYMLQGEEETSTTDKTAKKSGSTHMGTPDYVSPEQALGEALDGRSDVYSLAATLYALLTGEPPFQADTPIKMALMHVQETPTPLGLLRADVTQQIDLVMAKAMAKWPADRYQTAGEFAAAFKLAVQSAEEQTQSSIARTQRARQQTASPHTPASVPVPTQKNVPFKPLNRRILQVGRQSLLLVLVVALILACLFTALFIRSLNTGHASTTITHPTPTHVPGPFDSLLNDEDNWSQSSTFFFQDNGYSIENTSSTDDPAMAFYENHAYGDFRVQVTTQEVEGSLDGGDYYGLAFRGPLDQSHYYLFDVTAWDQGQYTFMRYDGGLHWDTLGSGSLNSFKTSKGAANTLSIEARGTTFTLFINGKQEGKPLHDHSKKALNTGEIGLMVEQSGTRVMFSHLYITAL